MMNPLDFIRDVGIKDFPGAREASWLIPGLLIVGGALAVWLKLRQRRR